ncbi:uncharacterized protein M6G45_015405 [Spheniscus humboldti]
MPFPTMAPCNVSPLLCSGSHGQIPQKPFRSTLRSRSCSGTSSSASGRDGKASKSQQLSQKPTVPAAGGRRCRQTRPIRRCCRRWWLCGWRSSGLQGGIRSLLG